MENILFFTKISAVFTVIYAGLNIHQLTSSYNYLLTKAEEFRVAATEVGGLPRLTRLNILFYLVMPFTYLALLRFSALQSAFVAILALKFLLTATLDLWIEKSIIIGLTYTKTQHNLSRIDNLFNIAAATSIVYLLLIGPPTPN